MLALEKVGAIDLTKMRKCYIKPKCKYRNAANDAFEYSATLILENNIDLHRFMLSIISDSFNRSMVALETAGGINRTKLCTKYRGVGSEYYDIVTEKLEGCIPLWQALEQELKITGKFSAPVKTSIL